MDKRKNTPVYKSVWQKMDEMAAVREEEARAKAVEKYGDSPTDAQVHSFRKGAARWKRDFEKYNESIGNALGRLAEQPQDIQGREVEIKRLQAVLERPITPVALLLGHAGVGKALDSDTLIPSVAGDGLVDYVRIGDLKEGDTVFDQHGNPTKVLGVYPQGEMEAWAVRFEDGSEVVCNSEHIWSVACTETSLDGQAEPRFEAMTLAEMIESGIVGGDTSPRYIVPMNGPVGGEQSVGLDFASREGGLFAETGRMPCEAHRWSVSEKTAFVKAAVMKAGRVEEARGEIRVELPCEEAAEEFCRLLRSIGVRPQARPRTFGRIDDPVWLVSLATAGGGSVKGAFPSEKGLVDGKGARGLAITWVRKMGCLRDMTCIRVESEEATFIAGECHVVTHNTALVEEFVKQSNQGRLDAGGPHSYMPLALRLGELSALERGRLQSALASMLGKLKKFEDGARRALNDPSIRIVLFIDEIHMIVTIFGQGTKIGGDVMKDMLARTPIRVIGATTRREYDSTIAVDKPFAERFKQIELRELDSSIVATIARNWWEKVAPDCPKVPDATIDYIIASNKAYRPDSAEPRKTLDVLEDGVSYCRRTRKPLSNAVVDEIFKDRFSIALGFNVDADAVFAEIVRRIKGQPAALNVLDLLIHATAFKTEQNVNKPIFTALFTGPTGSGKGTTVETPIPVLPTKANGFARVRKAGEVEIGDYVFSKDGKPEKVVGVYPQGMKDVYRVTLSDGRTLDVDGSHLWGVYPSRRARGGGLTIYSTETLIEKGITTNNKGHVGCKYVIPMNKAIEWPEAELECDPYVLGAFIGNGCLTESALTLSSNDDFVDMKVAEIIGACGYKKCKGNYNTVFMTGKKIGKSRDALVQAKDVIPDLLIGCKSKDKCIPAEYLYASIDQRWALVNGLFDTDGTIGSKDGDRFNISYSTASEQLANDVKTLMFSLGVGATVRRYSRSGISPDGKEETRVEYSVHLKIRNEEKAKVFSLPRKLELAKRAKDVARYRKRSFDYVGIRAIEKLPKQKETICLYVDHDEHLYQAGEFIVTHNTETTKAIAHSLYPGEEVIVTVNMPDYSTPDLEPLFRKELGEILRHTPNAVVLLDEFEKAAQNIKMSMLAILDEGLVRFTVQNREGREETNTASLRNAIVIATTNAGASVFDDDNKYNRTAVGNKDDSFDVIEQAQVERLLNNLRDNLIKNGFPPEMLGRFDQIVPYRALSEKTSLDILDGKLLGLVQDMRRMHGIEIELRERCDWDPMQYDCFANDVVTYIAFEKAKIRESNSGGARALMRELDTNVFYAIVRAIMANKDCRRFKVYVDGVSKVETPSGRIVFRLDNEGSEGIKVEPLCEETSAAVQQPLLK